MLRALIVLVTLALADSGVALATDANLDPSFGSYGWTSTNDGSAWDIGEDVAVQADGGIVVVGSGFVVKRFTAAGAVDATFGTGGSLYVNLGTYSWAHAVAIQSDGRIVVVGAGEVVSGNPGFAAVRLNTDGTFDPSFGTAGIALVDAGAGPGYETANSVAIQPDGRIVMVGTRYDDVLPEGVRSNIRAVRLLADGSLDTSFGTGGITVLGLGSWGEANDVAVQTDGKIVIGGYAYVPFFTGSEQAYLVMRLATDGTLDPAFGTAGVVLNDPEPEGSSIGEAIAVQPDGKILLGGYAGRAVTVLRLLSNGSADGAFGTGGVAKALYEDYAFAPAFDMVLRPDGRILLVGAVRRDGGEINDTALVRFNDDGSPDTTFAPNGRARIVIGARQSTAFGAAQQADGKIVVTGYRADELLLGPESDTALIVARFGGSCGNAFLDAGEQCDDGNTDGLDCCSAGCGFDPVGQVCDTVDATPCTYDTCDGAGTCALGGPWPASQCLAVTQPLASSLAIKDDPANTNDRIGWKWTKGPEFFYFGLPNFVTSHHLCVFAGTSLVSDNLIPAGAGWSGNNKGWKLKRNPTTTPGGIGAASLVSGPIGKSKITVKGRGPLVAAASAPLATPVTAQLLSSQGVCFGASYATPLVNAGGKFKAKGQ